jgi:DNA-binding transcriptional MerR regulator
MPAIDELPATPAHTIHVAAECTGVPAVTLRMWERRYGVVRPTRSGGNYRLYTDRDIALLRWLKHEVDSGVPIRQAAADLKRRLASDDWPQALPTLRPRRASSPPKMFVRRLFTSLVQADERQARTLLRQAGAWYDLDTLCLRILTPCLVEIGEAWHRGELRIAQEHFASSFLRGHLLSLYQAYPLRRSAPRVFVGCAPSEQHEIGALMVALFLRRGGCRVDYLGANLDAADLAAYARDQRPRLVALSAASDETALALNPAARRLGKLKPGPLFAFGGRAFTLEPSLRQEVLGRFLGEDAASGARAALSLLRLR